MNPIQIPQEWSDNGLITFEEFCDLIRTPQRTVRDWRQCGHRSAVGTVQRLRPPLHHRRRSPPVPPLRDPDTTRGAERWLRRRCRSTSASTRPQP
jgi:hypothetical protein